MPPVSLPVTPGPGPANSAPLAHAAALPPRTTAAVSASVITILRTIAGLAAMQTAIAKATNDTPRRLDTPSAPCVIGSLRHRLVALVASLFTAWHMRLPPCRLAAGRRH